MSSEDPFAKYRSAAGSNPDRHAASNLPAVEPPEEQIAELATQLEQCEAEKKELLDRHLRGAAELENYKKRVRREQSEAARYAVEPLVRDLLPIVDNLERAMTHASVGDGGGSLAQGVGLVLKALQDLLKQHGVRVVEAQPGAPFDPNLHEAVDRREVEGPPNRVVELWQHGYQMHDRLLRPAGVVVSAPPSTSAVANAKDRD